MMALAPELALKGTLVMAVSGLLVVLLRRRASAAWRHALCLLAVSSLLALPLFSAALPAVEIPIEVPAGTPMAWSHESVAALPKADARNLGTSPDSPVAETRDLQSAQPLPARPFPWLLWLTAIYVAGVVALVANLLVARWSMHDLARKATVVTDREWLALLRSCEHEMGVARPVRLLRSLEQGMPMAFGVRHPAILIPSVADTWSDDRRRAVLLHELAHVTRRDCLTQLITSVATIVYWPHPGVWWLARRLRVERERACDDRVLSIGTAARAYAEHLLELAYSLGGSYAPAVAVTMARPRELEGRMLAVLDHARNRATPARRAAIISVAAALAIAMPLAAADIRPVPKPETVPPMAPSTTVSTETYAPTQRTPARTNEDRRVPQQPSREPGTWELRPSRPEGRVNLRMTDRGGSSRNFTIDLNRLEGLTQAMLSGGRTDRSFTLKRDAGTFEFNGVFQAGVGAGTYAFVPSDTYPGELAKRGYARPTLGQQQSLAFADVGLTFVDELNRQGYAKEDIDTLVRAANHGVQYEYLRGMGDVGYRLGQLGPLIRMRDHGVDPEFIKGLADSGLSRLSADELVRARDHGVDPEEIRVLRSLGYDRLSIEQVITARNHGVDVQYVQSMRQLGFKPTIEELQDARDHGVNAAFAQGMIKQGYRNLSIGDLIRLRDHGVDPEWVRRQNARLREPMTVDELIRLRDRGGDR